MNVLVSTARDEWTTQGGVLRASNGGWGQGWRPGSVRTSAVAAEARGPDAVAAPSSGEALFISVNAVEKDLIYIDASWMS